LHLVDVGDERPHRGEEVGEARACEKTLLVALDGVPSHAHHEVLRFLHSPGHLVGQAVRIRIQNLAGLLVRRYEALRLSGRYRVTDVFDDHDASWILRINNTILYCIGMGGTASTAGRHRGRARDPGIDARVLAVAHGKGPELVAGPLPAAAVPREAGPPRQALYRRWPDKASLAADALKAAADAGPAVASEDPLADLGAELADFQRGISRP